MYITKVNFNGLVFSHTHDDIDEMSHNDKEIRELIRSYCSGVEASIKHENPDVIFKDNVHDDNYVNDISVLLWNGKEIIEGYIKTYSL